MRRLQVAEGGIGATTIYLEEMNCAVDVTAINMTEDKLEVISQYGIVFIGPQKGQNLPSSPFLSL